jgi:hypothetical protein
VRPVLLLRRRLLSKCDPIGEWQLPKDDNRTASISCGIRTSLRNELLVGHPQQHCVCAQAEGWLDTGAIAYLDASGLGLNVLFSSPGALTFPTIACPPSATWECARLGRSP